MKRKTTEQHKQELMDKWGDKVVAVGEYINNKTPMQYHCNVCGYSFSTRPNDIISMWKRWCPVCSNKIMGENTKKSNEQYLLDLKNVHGDNISAIEEYKENRDTKILHRCNICGHEWKATPHNILIGEGCPECKKQTISKLKMLPQEEFEKRLKAAWGNKIVLKDDYKGTNNKANFHCNDCGKDFRTMPRFILNNHGCPFCNKSNGEKQIEMFLEEKGIRYEPQKKFENCKNIRPLLFDFYLPDYNLCIEYQGEQHYEAIEFFGGEEELAKRQKNDKIKKEWCSEEENPSLLEIMYKDDIASVLGALIKVEE